MNSSKINLNLLQALDALLTERNVTRAGEKLYISQSAMSNTLNQLREMFKDDLLIRGKEGMELTPRAQELQPMLHQLISQMKALITKEAVFHPATSTRVFYITMSDLAEFFLLPYLLEILDKSAPNIELKIEHANYVSSPKFFIDNHIELAIGCALDENTHLMSEICYHFGGEVIARADHPLMKKKLTLSNYLKAKHIRVQYLPEYGRTNIDASLEKLGKKRHVVITMPDIIPLLFILPHSDLIATVPAFLSDELAKKFHIARASVPFEVPYCPTYCVWHRKNNNDPALIWLREQVQKSVKTVSQKIPGVRAQGSTIVI